MGGYFGGQSQLPRLPERIEIGRRRESRQNQHGHANRALIEKSERARQTKEAADAQGHGKRADESRDRAGSAQDAKDNRAQARALFYGALGGIGKQRFFLIAVEEKRRHRLAEHL